MDFAGLLVCFWRTNGTNTLFPVFAFDTTIWQIAVSGAIVMGVAGFPGVVSNSYGLQFAAPAAGIYGCQLPVKANQQLTIATGAIGQTDVALWYTPEIPTIGK
jgi:hypothetical protein